MSAGRTSPPADPQSPSATVRVIASAKTWIEGEAVQQLGRTATLPGMLAAIGMPDLHPGKGTPIGAAFLTAGWIYPYLVGNDVGCGMTLWSTDLQQRKVKLDRLADRLDLDGPWQGDIPAALSAAALAPTPHDRSLGTIGGGNHFAELQEVATVDLPELWDSLKIPADRLLLLVHSGSRGLGESILRRHVDRHAAAGLPSAGDEARAYLRDHDHAVAWATLNRALIAQRVAEALGAELTLALDAVHNAVLPSPDRADDRWLHRKGAAPADRGLVVIPGSRGALTYLVQPAAHTADAAWSLAHGAGRKWKRSDTKARLQARYRQGDLQRTALGGRVICEDRDLLYEEAPEAYKKIDAIIGDLVDAGLCQIVATFRPRLTYKTRQKSR